MHITPNSRTKGFTLIEILVVVAIISLLSSVVLAGVREAKQRAEVNAFVSQLKQVQTALELYRQDYGSYPNVYQNNQKLGQFSKNILSQYLPELNEYLNIDNNVIIYQRYDRNPYYRCSETATNTTYTIRFRKNLTDVSLPFETLLDSNDNEVLFLDSTQYCISGD